MKRKHDKSGPLAERIVAPCMAAPAVLLLTCFAALPFVIAVVFSFSDLRLGGDRTVNWVGLQQYKRVLGDPDFLRALLNNFIFAAVVVPLQTLLALALAVALNRRMPGRTVLRAVYFMPVLFPMALIAVVWRLIYAPEGPLNAIIPSDQPIDFLHDPRFALASLIVLSIWQGLGFQMIVLLAGLQSIPHVLYEAATIDRANAWQQFLHVTLPGLRNPLIFTCLLTSILAFRVFDQVHILTQGGPRRATTTVLFEAVRTIFVRLQASQAFAMTVIFFLIVLALTLLQRALLKEEREVL